MDHIIPYLVPPVLGAFIGYTTNYVAIRMLFRPLKPWYFLGIKLPMTPGVIPAKRHDLANNIGKMVGDHLLTSDDVQRGLNAQNFRKGLETLIYDKIDDALNRDLGPLNTIIPQRFTPYFHASVKVLRWRALKHLHKYIDADQFASKLTEVIASHLKDFLNQHAEALMPPKVRATFFAYLETTISNLLSSPKTTDWLKSATASKIDLILTEDQSIKDLLPEEIVNVLLDWVSDETPNLLAKAATLVEDPKMQEKMVKSICEAIDNFIASLGPMAALAGSLLTPEIIDQKVREFLADKGPDMAQFLIDDTVQEKLAQLFRKKAFDLATTPISSLTANLSQNKLDQIKDLTGNMVCELIFSPAASQEISSFINRIIESRLAEPVAELLTDMFSKEDVSQGLNFITQELIALARSSRVKRLLDNIVINLVEEKLLNQPIGPLANLIPQKIQTAFHYYLLQLITELLIREVPGLVDSLNIESMVKKKVDSLDLLKLEELLLSIMQEQFKYINMFGGFLGFIIGLCNLIFLL